jgi:endonuclease YncB( thermonuclease family)
MVARGFPWRVLLAALLVMLAGLASAEPAIGRVVGVTDGDTVTVLLPRNVQVKVRLAGIDAPEKRQPFGQRAKERLSVLVFGKTVTVVGTKRDRYRRLLAKLLVDGRDANVEMVSSGLAWHYKRYEAEQPREDRMVYSRAEMTARSERRGLWFDPPPVPPWEYRHR